MVLRFGFSADWHKQKHTQHCLIFLPCTAHTACEQFLVCIESQCKIHNVYAHLCKSMCLCVCVAFSFGCYCCWRGRCSLLLSLFMLRDMCTDGVIEQSCNGEMSTKTKPSIIPYEDANVPVLCLCVCIAVTQYAAAAGFPNHCSISAHIGFVWSEEGRRQLYSVFVRHL